jgi:hypothetical protein
MANHSIKTCFHLDWPREACDYLKKAVECISANESLYNIKMGSDTGRQLMADLIADLKSGKKLPESPGFQSLGTHTREVILRFLGSHELLGVSIEDNPDGGILVKDKDGMFNPNMMAKLLNAIMKDLNIPDFVSFYWVEGSNYGGEARVSRYIVDVTRVSELLEKMNRIEEQINNMSQQMDKEMNNRIFKAFGDLFRKNDQKMNEESEPDDRPPAPW